MRDCLASVVWYRAERLIVGDGAIDLGGHVGAGRFKAMQVGLRLVEIGYIFFSDFIGVGDAGCTGVDRGRSKGR